MKVGEVQLASKGLIAQVHANTKDLEATLEKAKKEYVGKKMPSPRLSRDMHVRFYKAVARYETTDSEELPFAAGEVLKVLSQSEEGWWVAKNKQGKQGFVPYNYLDLDNEVKGDF